MTLPPVELDPDHCRRRQQRLIAEMNSLSLDRVCLTSHENVQYLTGFRPHRLMQAAVYLNGNGTCLLIAPNDVPDNVAADDIRTFEAQWHCTLRQEQSAAVAEVLQDALPDSSPAGTGLEFAERSGHIRQALSLTEDLTVDIDPVLWRLRRHKDPDELSMIRRAIACTEAMYARARDIIQPGITELQVFNELHAAAVEVAGEPLTALGNDYQCNSGGGPPRNRPAQNGELFVLDLGPAYRGYYADNCRTIAVSDNPTDLQQQAWQNIVDVLQMVEDTVKPGVSCKAVFEQAHAMLKQAPVGEFPHHLGHGFGLFPHTAPHLNPFWNDTFEVGDTFTAEPGLYADELSAGIRLEQNYLVTEDGVELLTTFDLGL